MEAAARVLEFYQSAEEGGELQLHIIYIKGKRVSQLGKSIYVNLLTKHMGYHKLAKIAWVYVYIIWHHGVMSHLPYYLI